MRKLFVILFVIIFCAVLLCACNAESRKNSSSFLENETLFENSSSNISRPPTEPVEEGEYSLQGESAFKDNTSVKYLGMADDIEVYQKAVESDETRLDIVYGKDGTFNTITEVLATEYWIIDSEGNLLIEHPFYDLCFWEGNEIIGIELYHTSGLEGCYKGNEYIYSFIDGKFEQIEFYKAGEYTQSSTPSGYRRTRYSYSVKDSYNGLNDSEGNVIFEPVYTYFRFPFEDRIIVKTNNIDPMDDQEGFSVLMDIDKNILCTYTVIDFYVFDNGSYIGIARYCGGEILFDKNGEPLELGFRFIDKNGNELSPCLGTEYLAYSTDEYVENYFDEFLIDFEGNPLKITGRDFICEP